MGLPIARSLVELMGGDLVVESPYNNDDDDGPLWNAKRCTART